MPCLLRFFLQIPKYEMKNKAIYRIVLLTLENHSSNFYSQQMYEMLFKKNIHRCRKEKQIESRLCYVI
jgi:hypothetical protein